MRITVMCHGEVAGCTGIFCGRRDDPLTALGLEQMNAVAECLAKKPFERITSSPQVRCKAFSEQFARSHGLELDLVPSLAELDYGEWEGLTAQEAAFRDPESYRVFRGSAGKVAPPGGETSLQLRRRVRDVLSQWTTKPPAANMLLVTHPGVMRALLTEIIEMRDAYSWRIALPLVAHCVVTLPQAAAPELLSLNSCF